MIFKRFFYYIALSLFMTSPTLGSGGAFAQAEAPTVYNSGTHVKTFDFIGAKGPANIYRLNLIDPPLDLEMIWSGSAANVLKVFNQQTDTSTILPIRAPQKSWADDTATSRATAAAGTSGIKSRLALETPDGGFVYTTYTDDKFLGFMIVQSDGKVDFISP